MHDFKVKNHVHMHEFGKGTREKICTDVIVKTLIE
jgi:hypothetical protein